MRIRVLALAALAAAAACKPPKYAVYTSVAGDFTASVPWGWRVMTENSGSDFAQATFIGPFDPDFFLGAPSLSVRWYRRYAPRALRYGRTEMYADADDFINQMIRQVYGADLVLYGAGRREDGGREIIKAPQEVTLKGAGLKAWFFGVLSPTPAPPGNRWGVDTDDEGRPVNIRMHDYVVVPMEGGFYVLCYPATLRGYPKGVELFRALVNTFRPLTAGPGGPKASRPVPAALKS